MAVANQQVDVATNNTENMRRLVKTAPDAHASIKVIWQSPLIPSDPLVWRKDLDAETKAKLYTFVMTYGRNGDADQVKRERAVLTDLGWAPFRPSSNGQLFPIRQLAINKEILKVQGDEKLSQQDKDAKVEELRAESQKIAEMMETIPNS